MSKRVMLSTVSLLLRRSPARRFRHGGLRLTPPVTTSFALLHRNFSSSTSSEDEAKKKEKQKKEMSASPLSEVAEGGTVNKQKIEQKRPENEVKVVWEYPNDSKIPTKSYQHLEIAHRFGDQVAIRIAKFKKNQIHKKMQADYEAHRNRTELDATNVNQAINREKPNPNMNMQKETQQSKVEKEKQHLIVEKEKQQLIVDKEKQKSKTENVWKANIAATAKAASADNASKKQAEPVGKVNSVPIQQAKVTPKLNTEKEKAKIQTEKAAKANVPTAKIADNASKKQPEPVKKLEKKKLQTSNPVPKGKLKSRSAWSLFNWMKRNPNKTKKNANSAKKYHSLVMRLKKPE